MGWALGEEERGQGKGGGEILEVGKGGMWQNGMQRIKNTKQRRDKREQNGWNGQGTIQKARQSSMPCG